MITTKHNKNRPTWTSVGRHMLTWPWAFVRIVRAQLQCDSGGYHPVSSQLDYVRQNLLFSNQQHMFALLVGSIRNKLNYDCNLLGLTWTEWTHLAHMLLTNKIPTKAIK